MNSELVPARCPRERLFLFALGGALLSLAQPGAAAAGGPPDVAIVAAAMSSSTSAWFTDPQSRLIASGYFGAVDIINASTTTPTLAELQAYDAVITWSNVNYQNATALGDVLADYVDAGGGVVVAVFANTSTSTARFLQGRWLSGGYEIVVSQGGSQTGSATLGTVHVPGHPLMTNVNTFDGGTSSFRPVTTARTPGSVLIASWSDGKPLVATHGTHARRVDLGFYPPSNAASSSFWVGTTDGGALLSNALLYAATNGSSSTPFCSGDGSAAACPCGNNGAPGNGCGHSLDPNGANLSTSGLARLSNDTLVLRGSNMPNAPALYFQGTNQFAGGAGAAFGDGLRCAGGTIIRLKTVANVGGASQYPGAGDPSVSVRGLVAAPGLRTYQVWFRNAAEFCTPSTFNLTNGVEVAWTN